MTALSPNALGIQLGFSGNLRRLVVVLVPIMLFPKDNGKQIEVVEVFDKASVRLMRYKNLASVGFGVRYRLGPSVLVCFLPWVLKRGKWRARSHLTTTSSINFQTFFNISYLKQLYLLYGV